MSIPLPVILIFDIGKTNKKMLLFDKQYNLVYQTSEPLAETEDEDGFPCEDVALLTHWIRTSFQKIKQDKRFAIVAINASAYGASFVHLNKKKEVVGFLYNYIKPYPEALLEKFYNQYGSKKAIAEETASPQLGNLNSGMQLYWLKYGKPHLFSQIKYSLHLPQYIAFVLSGSLCSDITSLGCHTNLWSFANNNYHTWVYKEEVDKKLPPVASSSEVAGWVEDIPVGVGLHDSSAALIPYLSSFSEPFLLLSTGTWSISLNPFNHTPVTSNELEKDCLCYLSYTGAAIKASRLFAGYEHQQQVERMAAHYCLSPFFFNDIKYNSGVGKNLYKNLFFDEESEAAMMPPTQFAARNLTCFATVEEAYHQLMFDIVKQQISSTKLVMEAMPAKRMFIDGGFSKNNIFMTLLATAFPQTEVYAAHVAQASALGAAIALQKEWNDDEPLPAGWLALNRCKAPNDIVR